VKFVVEAWSPEYGVSGDESQLDEHAEPVDLSVEVPANNWEPIPSSDTGDLKQVVFVDGVRRVTRRRLSKRPFSGVFIVHLWMTQQI